MIEGSAPLSGGVVPVRCERTPEYGVLVITFLGDVVGLYHHRDRKRTPPCLGKECPHGRHLLPLIYYGYAPAERWLSSSKRWITCIVQITSNQEESIRNRPLRGEISALSRAIEGDKNSAGLIQYVNRAEECDIGADFEVAPVLRRIFCCGEEMRMGASNQTPPRMTRPVSECPRRTCRIFRWSQKKRYRLKRTRKTSKRN